MGHLPGNESRTRALQLKTAAVVCAIAAVLVMTMMWKAFTVGRADAALPWEAAVAAGAGRRLDARGTARAADEDVRALPAMWRREQDKPGRRPRGPVVNSLRAALAVGYKPLGA